MDATFSVPEISCDGCARSIRATLEKLPGVEILGIDVKEKRVRARLDDEHRRSAVEQALTDAGYPVKGGGPVSFAP